MILIGGYITRISDRQRVIVLDPQTLGMDGRKENKSPLLCGKICEPIISYKKLNYYPSRRIIYQPEH